MFVIENKQHKEPQTAVSQLSAHYSVFGILFIVERAIYGYFYGY